MSSLENSYTKASLFKSILKKDFPSFIHKCFVTLNPTTHYSNNWHIEMLAEYLESVRKNEIKRLIINIPPRNLKSICVNVAWTAWLLGLNPSTKIISTSYSMPLSVKHNLDTRFIMESEWYKQVFPDSTISKRGSSSKITTTAKGFRLSSSVGGTITGEGGDVLIMDDPHNPTYIYSDKLRNKVTNWYEQTFASRLNDQKNGSIVLVMQRLHNNDLSGYLLNNDKSWHVLKLPIYADQDYEYVINSKKYFFQCGDILDASRYGRQEIEKLQNDLKIHNFQAQYMQSPPQKGCIINTEMLHFYAHEPQIEYIIQSWDTAVKISDSNDYSVCTTWGVSSGKFYLIDMFRKRLEYPCLRNAALMLIKQHKPLVILIEDKTSGQALIQDLKAERNHNIVPQKPRFDKATRLVMVLEMIKNGTVLFPEYSHWKQTVVSEITEFPLNKHDDILDTITQLLHYVKSNPAIIKEPTIRRL